MVQQLSSRQHDRSAAELHGYTGTPSSMERQLSSSQHDRVAAEQHGAAAKQLGAAAADLSMKVCIRVHHM